MSIKREHLRQKCAEYGFVHSFGRVCGTQVIRFYFKKFWGYKGFTLEPKILSRMDSEDIDRWLNEKRIEAMFEGQEP